METNSNAYTLSPFFRYSLTVLFFSLSFIGICHHELWLDEAHHYLLGRDSHSFRNLIANTRYDGHPILWNLLMHYITRFTVNPFYMQLLHISISTISISIFFKKAPFSWVFKVLFIFGYFMFFEYNILSRNYSIGVLFTFLACSFYSKRIFKFITISTFLGVACNSHAVFLILASTIMLILTWERLFSLKKIKYAQTYYGIFIFSALAGLSILQIIPPGDNTFFDNDAGSTLLQKIPKSIAPFFKALCLIPNITLHSFWNENLIVSTSKSIAGLLSLLALTSPYFLFKNNKMVQALIYIGICAAGLFFYITNLNAARYYGILYLLFCIGLWFHNTSPNIQRDTIRDKKIRHFFVYTVLIIHFSSGIYAYTMDIIYPFTTSKQAADYIKKHVPNETIIASLACNGSAFSAYIEEPIFFTKTNNYGSFCIFNKSVINFKTPRKDIIKSLETLRLESEEKTIIFITYAPFFDTDENKECILPNSALKIKLLQQFNGSILKKGNHYLYEISEYKTPI